jgi:hypothetical protein
MQLDNPVIMKLKDKYTKGGKGQLGFKPPAGGGNSTKKRANKHKASEAQRKAILLTQRKRVLVLQANGKLVMRDA